MRVRLAPELFEAPVAQVLLTALFQYALDDRHRVEADLTHPLVAGWLARQSDALREEITVAVDTSIEAEALEPSATVAEVGTFHETDFGAEPIRLRWEDARAFLDKPFTLLFEDRISDREFLLRMLTEEERRSLQDQLRRGLVRVEHGGGLPGMRRHLMDNQGDPSLRYKLWVMFDSDALQPGQPSRQSEDLRAACEGITHYQLRRRYIESYLPAHALHAWASQGRDRRSRSERFELLRAFLRMTPVQRHHFNMKGGFARDARRNDASAGTLYDDVADVDKRLMQSGFGDDVGDLFGSLSQQPQVKESDLRRDSGWSELRPVVRQLLARLR